jgi:biotin carboxylase
MGKTLLIISGGIEAVPGIKLAKAMDLHVVVSDINQKAPGFALADDRIIASTYDIDETVAAAERYDSSVRKIDGVICIAADVPLTVASVASALGLTGIPVRSATLAANKMAMKECFSDAGIPAPWFSAVGSVEQLNEIIAEKGYPLVIKPTDSRGARGVLRLTEDIDLEWAFGHSLQFSPSSRVMVEEYLEGPQISTESMLLSGRGVTPGFIDRNYEYLHRFAPYIIENGGQQPSRLNEDERASVSKVAEMAGRAIGIRDGVVKGDMVLTPQGPKVIEIAARLSGGWMSTDQIPLGTGVDLVGSAIRLALGEEVDPEDLKPRCQNGVAIRYFFPEPGIIADISNLKEFQDVSWVHRLCLFANVGEVIEPVTNHTKRAGFVITTAKTANKAVELAARVTNGVRIRTAPKNG